jgi:hypothetical protein
LASSPHRIYAVVAFANLQLRLENPHENIAVEVAFFKVDYRRSMVSARRTNAALATQREGCGKDRESAHVAAASLRRPRARLEFVSVRRSVFIICGLDAWTDQLRMARHLLIVCWTDQQRCALSPRNNLMLSNRLTNEPQMLLSSAI